MIHGYVEWFIAPVHGDFGDGLCFGFGTFLPLPYVTSVDPAISAGIIRLRSPKIHT